MLHTGKHNQVLIRILCVLALVMLSFAHKPVDVSAPLLQMTTQSGTADEPVFIRYETMPDGSIVSICVSGTSDEHHKSHNMMADCEACRISAGFALVVPPLTGGPVVTKDSSDSVRRTAHVLPRARDYPPSAPPQAPPFLA